MGGVVWSVATVLDLDLTVRQAMRATFVLWPTSLVFGSLALAVSTVARQRAVAMGLPAAIVLLSYLALVIGRLAPPVEVVRYLSAYNYYGVAILEGVRWLGMAILGIAALVLLVFTVIAFNRRDIYA